MAEVRQHKKPESIWLFDYNSLASMDDCAEFMVWLSERDINLIWQAVLNIERFRSRVFTAKDGDNYTIADLDQFGQYKEWVSDMNVHMGDYLMCNELLSEIKDALVALAEKECCPGGGGGVGGGSGGAGLDGAAPSTTTDSPEARTGPAPAGFEDWPAWDAYKCNMAHYIITQMIGDIATINVIAALGHTAPALALALVTALFTPIGWAVMIGLAGLALSWLLLGAEISALTSFLGDSRDDLICAMIEADTTPNSINAFTAKVDELVPDYSAISTYGSIAVYLAKQYINAFATTDSFNRLYTKVAYEIPGDKDCSMCGPQTIAYTVSYGNEITENPATPIQVEMVFETGYGCGSAARHGGISFSGPVTITYFNVSGTGVGQCGGGHICYYYSDSGGVTLITSKPANNVEEVTGVQSIYSFCAVSSGNPTLEIGYLPE